MRCSANKCKREAQINGVCDIHYWHAKWLDNSDINNLGIILFSKMLLPEWVRNDSPIFHREVYYAFLSLYKEPEPGFKKDKYDRLLAEIGFRGASKTTRSKILLCYCCCFALEKFIIYCSQTNTFAVQDVFEVRRELSTNPLIRYYFGVINSKAVEGQDGEWSRDAYRTSTGVYVLARGVGQQVRSALRNSYRPTLAIINDMYSKDSVKTEYTRAEYAKWFFQDMFNAIDDLDGKVFFNGTILHEDTVPVVLEKNSQWKVIKYPVMDIDDFHRVLRECNQTDATIELPSLERIKELEKTCKIAWVERLDLHYILKKYKEAYESGQVAGFYQEYFHIIVPPDEKSFKNVKRAKMTFIRADRRTWLKVEFDKDKEVIYEVNIYLGVDPASATTQSSKFTAIVYIAMNQHRQVFILGYAHGKFGLRDELEPSYVKKTDSDIVEPVRSNIRRIGMVDEEIRLVKQFRAVSSTVETVQQQQSVYDEINRLMRRNNALHRLYSVKPTQEKIERDADILMPYFQTGSIFLNYNLPELEHELDQFPRGTTVDLIDALAYAVVNARPAEGIEFADAYKTNHEDEFETNFYVL